MQASIASGHAPEDSQVTTLADLLAHVASDPSLSQGRRRNISSSLRRLGHLLGRELYDLPAKPGALRELLEDFHPARVNMSPRRWANIRSDLLFALKRYCPEPVPGRSSQPLSPEWQALYERLPGEDYTRRLSRFIRYCSTMNIRPGDVCDNVAETYLKALIEQSFVKHPATVHRRTCVYWNRAAARVPGWPQTLLTVPDNRRSRTLGWDAFPPSLKADTEAWLKRLSGVDLLDDDMPERGLSPSTLESRRYLIHVFASALVRAGRDPATINSLRDLVEPDAFKTGLRVLYEEQGARKTLALYHKAIHLKAMARHWAKAGEAHIAELSGICVRLAPRTGGLTEKNRARLRPFMDQRNAARLVRWPQEWARKIDRSDRGGRCEARAIQTALAVEILLFAPIRLGNLSTIRVDRHLCWTRAKSKGVVHLVFPAEEVKNREPLEFELTHDTVKLLELYLRKYRPRLVEKPSPWLFPGRNGGPKRSHSLSGQIKKGVFEAIGYKVNVHLFRHLAAMFYLNANPGGYEVVRRTLGQRSIHTTTSFYTGLEAISAVKHFDAQILKLRQELPRSR